MNKNSGISLFFYMHLVFYIWHGKKVNAVFLIINLEINFCFTTLYRFFFFFFRLILADKQMRKISFPGLRYNFYNKCSTEKTTRTMTLQQEQSRDLDCRCWWRVSLRRDASPYWIPEPILSGSSSPTIKHVQK